MVQGLDPSAFTSQSARMSNNVRFGGAFTALVTPFSSDASRVDFEALEALVTSQLQAGICGLVPCGTTGESPALTEQEQLDVVRTVAKLASGKVPVIAGTGSNCTHKSIVTSLKALEAGADGVMIVMPYYNKPTQEGLYQHVTTIASELKGAPVVLYNIPGRTGVDLSMDTLRRIVDRCPNIAAVKDATGNVLRVQQCQNAFGESVAVMCGDDPITLPMMVCGARGVISVTSNLYPAQVVEVCRLAQQGLWEKARALHLAMLELHEVMFIETNPGPIKAALAHAGKIKAAMRLPMRLPSDSSTKKIIDVMAAYEKRAMR
jgi:4-hydroxy-tetrahydrodipicolinate synthase